MNGIPNMLRAVKSVLPVLVGLAVISAGGCTASKHKVTGKVTRDGKPLEWKTDNGILAVTFVPLDRDKDKTVYPAETETLSVGVGLRPTSKLDRALRLFKSSGAEEVYSEEDLAA